MGSSLVNNGKIKSMVSNDAFRDNFDNIFRKDNDMNDYYYEPTKNDISYANQKLIDAADKYVADDGLVPLDHLTEMLNAGLDISNYD